MCVFQIWVEFFEDKNRFLDQSGSGEASDEEGCGAEIKRNVVIFRNGEKFRELGGWIGLLTSELEDGLE